MSKPTIVHVVTWTGLRYRPKARVYEKREQALTFIEEHQFSLKHLNLRYFERRVWRNGA